MLSVLMHQRRSCVLLDAILVIAFQRALARASRIVFGRDFVADNHANQELSTVGEILTIWARLEQQSTWTWTRLGW